MPNPTRLVRLWLVAMWVANFFPGLQAHADSLAEDNAKAGFIFNFTKYTEWPAAAISGGDFLVCSLSAQALSGKLELMQGKQVLGRTIRLRTSTRASEWRECQVMFIAANEAQRINAVLQAVDQHPVLTISDAPDFVQSGGIIGLKLRGGRIRFEINQGAARQAGLKLSSQLLKLADEVLQ